MTEQDSYTVMPSLAKILLRPGSPGCHVAVLDHGLAHRQAGASCSGQGWEGGKGKYFTRCAASSSSGSMALSVFIPSLQKAVQKTSRGKANAAMAKQARKWSALDVLAQLGPRF